MPSPRLFFCMSLCAGAFVAVWTWLVLGRHETEAFDLTCAHFWYEQAHEHRWSFPDFFTDLGSVAAMTLLTIVGALWQASLKNRLLVLAWIVVMSGGGLLNAGIKPLVGRERPPADLRDRVILEVDKSYPSGHSMGSAFGYGLLAYTLCLWQRCRGRRLWIVIVTACIVLAIGFSRIYLRAHWFSDVVAGWSIGLTWLFFCLGWLERSRQPTAGSRQPDASS